MTFQAKAKATYTKICHEEVFILGISVANCVKITTKVPDHCYDLGVKGQGQMCLKSVLYNCVSQRGECLFHILMERVRIKQYDFIYIVIKSKVSDHQYDPKSRSVSL